MKANQVITKEVRIVTSIRRAIEDTVKARRPAKAARSERRNARREIQFALMESV